MSFSSIVKEELSHQIGNARHCQIAELSAILRLCGRILKGEAGADCLQIRLENPDVVQTCEKLLHKAFRAETEETVKGELHILTIRQEEKVTDILEALKLMDPEEGQSLREDLVSTRIIQNSCCRRAFLRGAFLACGSISNPEKSYHLEFVLPDEAKALQLKEILGTCDIEAKIVLRKKYHVVYIKEGDQIVELLGVMEAHQAFMNLENVRILKEMRGSVNRVVNCETANINKTVTAAVEQLDDILLIRDRIGFENLPENLAAAALARMENPEATLKELGDLMDPPVGKSGVNHRLQKLRKIAETLREKEEAAL